MFVSAWKNAGPSLNVALVIWASQAIAASKTNPPTMISPLKVPSLQRQQHCSRATHSHSNSRAALSPAWSLIAVAPVLVVARLPFLPGRVDSVEVGPLFRSARPEQWPGAALLAK